MASPANLKEIAKRAGVSVMTASNVVNGREGKYSADTYERVMRAAAEVGYVPNLAAKHLRNGKMGLIAFILPDIRNPYFSELAQYVIQDAEALGYTVLLSFTDTNPEIVASIVNGAQQLPVDGVILAPFPLDFKGANITKPMVLLWELKESTQFDNIVLDHELMARTATQHLIDIGQRRIAPIGFVNTVLTSDITHPRTEGYIQAMKGAGLEIDPQWFIPLPEFSYHRDFGASTMLKLLELDNPPDAVFCYNDLLAIGAMKVLLEKGYRVPDDVAVIGIDGIQEGRYSSPSLSTVAVDRRTMSQMAVRLLIERITGKRSAPPEYFHSPFALYPRESTLGDKYTTNIEALIGLPPWSDDE